MLLIQSSGFLHSMSTRRLAAAAVLAALWLAPAASFAADNGDHVVGAENTYDRPYGPYQSGPFYPNPTGEVFNGGACFNFTVRVNGTTTPRMCEDNNISFDFTGVSPTDLVVIKTSWKNSAEDFDTYLFDSDGRVITHSASSSSPEVMTALVSELTDEVYTIRIVAHVAAGGTWTEGTPDEGTLTEVYISPGMPDSCKLLNIPNGGSAALSPLVAHDLMTLSAFDNYGAFVHFSTGTPEQHRALLGARGLTIGHDFEKDTNTVFAIGAVSAFKALVTEPSVSYIEDNRPLRYLGDTGSWATRARVAQEGVSGGPYKDAGGARIDGSGITVAVVDSGVNVAHQDFTDNNRVRHNYKIVGADGDEAVVGAIPNGDPSVQELPPGVSSDTTGGHGTHVAGIVLGSGAASSGDYPIPLYAPNVKGTFTGVAPGANLVAYGAGETLVVLSSVIAFQHILDNHTDSRLPANERVRVVSNSWGAAGGGAYNPGDLLSCKTQQLVTRGVSVVFAAANDGGDGTFDTTSPTCKDPTPGVICVANYDDNGTGALNHALAASSSRGTRGEPTTYPDISAPGTLITSTCAQTEPGQAVCTNAETRWQPYYGTISGTSMATPHVSGALALLYQARPDLTPAQAEKLIQDSARKVTFNGAYEEDPQNQSVVNKDGTTTPGGTINFGVGAGLLNVQAALDALGVTHAVLPVAGAEAVIFAGDKDFATELPAAADVTRLSMQEDMTGTPGVTYRISVRDAAERFALTDPPTATGIVTYRLEQNVNGTPFVTLVQTSPKGVASIPPQGLDNTAVASSASQAGNVITFFVPYSQLGYPPTGAPVHNMRVLGSTEFATDYAPSPSQPSTSEAQEPMFGRPFTVQRDAGPPPSANACGLPGLDVITDLAGDVGAGGTGGIAGLLEPSDIRLAPYDIKSVHAAEPGGKLAITLTVGDLSTLPSDTLWAVRFSAPNPPENGDSAYFVGFSTLGGTPRYVYGTSFEQSTPVASVLFYRILGDIDPSSGFTPEGVITLIADEALFAIAPGDLLNDFIATVRPIVQDSDLIAGGSLDTAEGGFYVVQGGVCSGAGKSGGGGGGALGLPSVLALLGAFAAFRRRGPRKQMKKAP